MRPRVAALNPNPYPNPNPNPNPNASPTLTLSLFCGLAHPGRLDYEHLADLRQAEAAATDEMVDRMSEVEAKRKLKEILRGAGARKRSRSGAGGS